MESSENKGFEIATFGAGCFWGIEETFRNTPGVVNTEVGYMGGHVADPTYQDVCSDRTGHAEVVQVSFNPQQVTYDQLLQVFWHAHDPTQFNRQGPDVGSQYRSVVFYRNNEQRLMAETTKENWQQSPEFSGRQIQTEIAPADVFYRAEEYHQQYLMKRGEASCRTH
ncbi:peptide-methionine (S)-S-oxide reductase MsrA [Pontibacter flavimaris]|uniref:Peptide methionine sulfoxide reductase MsrA n=1 Tax=Pontibacter flavimaris TaxID=1797110 RepID=A0A1Q5PG20_9BACT|nr:peptide-methionine (S)-S-oxide reductase MsrA [Pontibacter flavimaris]OKL41111.1 peptide-methionine (S)-S-oxide reductase [Pontibacter flavimaris]